MQAVLTDRLLKHAGCMWQTRYSNMWLYVTEATTNHPIWWHYLMITVPDVIKYEEAILIIEGGSNHDR